MQRVMWWLSHVCCLLLRNCAVGRVYGDGEFKVYRISYGSLNSSYIGIRWIFLIRSSRSN